jgi:hypothetical protein
MKVVSCTSKEASILIYLIESEIVLLKGCMLFSDDDEPELEQVMNKYDLYKLILTKFENI